MAPLPPLSLYVHLPWCVRKCPYCDFNSHQAPAQIPQAQYVDALLADIDVDAAFIGGREITSIFFGGGTPSLFSPAEIARFLQGVGALAPLACDVEITLEANPGAIEHGRFEGYRAAGVNRISLGVQSFNPEHLHVLGRIHSAADIPRAVDELRRAGFENFNLDLMYGLPGQTVGQALDDLEQAFALGPTHLSHYQLTLEPGTVFYHRPPALPDAETTWAMQVESQARLAATGYRQYEVSAYARAGFQCRHNLNYWCFGDYLGVGAGAHGKLTRRDSDLQIVRTQRSRQPREYLSQPPLERLSRSDVGVEDAPFEYMLNALRLTDGFTAAEFEARTGVGLVEIEPLIAQAISRGLLERTLAGWRPTELGGRFLNDLQALFLERPSRTPSERPAAP